MTISSCAGQGRRPSAKRMTFLAKANWTKPRPKPACNCVGLAQRLQDRGAKISAEWNHRSMSVQTGTKRKEGGFAETVRVIIHALIIALVIRTFLFQPFNIPSGSMIPTLLVGDYLFVSKYSYGYTHY